MTIETIPNSSLRYYLISFDKNGEERMDDLDAFSGCLSDTVKQILKNEPITDVFFMSHGWKGDVPAAKEQYEKWTQSMLECEADRNKIRQLRPDFRPLLIGLHWPSLPWGDESLTASSTSFGTSDASPIESLIDDAADKLVDTERARDALKTIFEAALDDMAPPKLSQSVVSAFKTLYDEAGLNAGGVSAAPGFDADGFDPERIYQHSLADAASFGEVPGVGGILSVVRQLSFWTMKARARSFGESGGASLLRDLQSIAADRHKNIGFHLMGHSFGCIVVSATVAGADGNTPLIKPVDSLFLVQGALSIWSYCNDIPYEPGNHGYFNAIACEGKVAGPIVTTQSDHDAAVRRLYPLGAGLKRQIDFAPEELPKYGGVGTFGVQGPGIEIENMDMLPADVDYDFGGSRVYNLEGSVFINEGKGLSGAHSDIAKPAVAHAFWQAVISSVLKAMEHNS
jgi:hypothetical protein